MPTSNIPKGHRRRPTQNQIIASGIEPIKDEISRRLLFEVRTRWQQMPEPDRNRIAVEVQTGRISFYIASRMVACDDVLCLAEDMRDVHADLVRVLGERRIQAEYPGLVQLFGKRRRGKS